MTIKKSTLEQKWYYRLAKVFFLILPFLIAVLFILKKRIVICSSLIQENILNLSPNYVVFIAVALILYFLFLVWIWRGFLYIVFGGLEDDTKKQENNQSSVKTESQHEKTAQIIPFIIALIIFTIIALSLMGYIKLPKINLDNNNNNSDGNSGSATCPTRSNPPCNSVKSGIKTSGVIVPGNCNCPSDTVFAQMDNITKGGPYKICTCN